MEKMRQAAEILRRYGIRPSHQRVSVMEYILHHPSHRTADEIYDGLLEMMPTISKATIYNTMRLFKDSGAVNAIHIGAEPLRFDTIPKPHAHFYCNVCRQIHDVEIDPELWEKVKAAVPEGAEELQIFFKGTCENCS